MELRFHKNCKTNKSHKPEISMEVDSPKKACAVIRLEKVKLGYLDWDKKRHYICYADKYDDYTSYQKTARIKTCRV